MKLLSPKLLLTLIVLSITAFAFQTTQSANEKKASMKAKITGITKGPPNSRILGQLSVLIQEGLSTNGDSRASIRITRKTRILKQTDQTTQEADFAGLREGQDVEIKPAGPMIMSYPVQVEAEEILIKEES